MLGTAALPGDRTAVVAGVSERRQEPAEHAAALVHTAGEAEDPVHVGMRVHIRARAPRSVAGKAPAQTPIQTPGVRGLIIMHHVICIWWGE